MMETTVTMTLREYKALESKADAFDQLMQDQSKFLCKQGWDGIYYVALSNEPNAVLLQEVKMAREDRDHTINKVREYEKRTGKKVFEYTGSVSG